ncbi:MAG TPA: SRPBCC domain-containing protein [Candidatus Saccharimonadales bacterium]|nr:SRPBCC domain-containing protein [Candidatus Saccharimonadales bacterium]
MQDAITKEITINAPIRTVWEVVTKPEHMAKWFAESAVYKPAVGEKGAVSWSGMADAPIEITAMDEPHTFAFNWVAPDEEVVGTDNKTLITFTLEESGAGTRVQVTESGFSKLAIADEQKKSLMDKHVSGWPYFLGKLDEYVQSI